MDGWKWWFPSTFLMQKVWFIIIQSFKPSWWNLAVYFSGSRRNPPCPFGSQFLKDVILGVFGVPIAVEIALSHWTTIRPLTDPAPRTSRDLLVYKKNFNEKVIRDPPWNPGGTGQGVKGLILWRKTSLARKIRRFCKSKSKNKFQRETKAWYERSELLVHGRILK